MIQITIQTNDQNKRLDNFIKKYLNNAPLSYIYKLFRKKDIKVNKKPAKPEYITQLNDIITIYVNEEDLHVQKNIKISHKKEFDILYEDANILIVNKPIHLLVHDGENISEDTLSRQVLNYLIEKKEYDPNKENTFVPSLAHRIDRNTSGIVIFGKTNIALQLLFEAFKNHDSLSKKYIALVAGQINQVGEINAPLLKDEKLKKVYVHPQGLFAKTLYQPIQKFNHCSLIELTILTGRTHQIRVHMQSIKHPLIGDKKYGNKETDDLAKLYQMKNYFLHAKEITFKSLKGELQYLNNQSFVAPLYQWQKDLIKKLTKENTK